MKMPPFGPVEILKRALPNISVRDERFAKEVIERLEAGKELTRPQLERVYRILNRSGRKVAQNWIEKNT